MKATKLHTAVSGVTKRLERHKTVVQNFSYLSALQIFGAILPLVTYPYLIRVLGAETYGLVVFAQAVVGYLLILVGFGFNISATRDVSVHRDDQEKLSEIVSSVLIIKGLLFILSFAVLAVVLYFIPQARGYQPLFFFTMWMCLYEVIFPAWYFQGIERMKYMTYLTLLSRLIALGLIFVLIREPSDYLLVPVISGIGAIIAGLFSLFIVFSRHGIAFRFQARSTLWRYFSDSTPVFISNLSVQVYLATNKILIGLFLSLSDVAYYDLGEKILNLFKLPVHVLSQVIFPKMSKAFDQRFLKKTIGFVFLMVSALIIIFQFIAADVIVVFAGRDMLPATNVARLLILSLLPLIISNGLGIQTLLSKGYNREYTRTVVYATVLYFVLVLLLIIMNKLTIYTLPAVSILIEVYMLFSFYTTCKKLKLIG